MLQISENAAALIKKMTLKNGMPGGGLRIGIKAGGCSGLSYTFAWEAAPREGDHVFEGAGGLAGVRRSEELSIHPRHHARLRHGPVSRGFIFNNPNAKSTCGCGTSFSV